MYGTSKYDFWIFKKKQVLKLLFSCFTYRPAFFQLLNVKKIPVIINSYNRLSCIQSLIEFLEANGYKNIVILDNQSSYEPLLDYYKTLPYRIIYLDQNYGHMALWLSGVIDEFAKGFFAYTDPDVLPDKNCPANFMRHFLKILFKFPQFKKVGFGLRIDDLPDHYAHKNKVLAWEDRFWQKQISKDLYEADLDTTFALYIPNYPYKIINFYQALRTSGKYVARHLGWYQNTDNPTPEDIYYASHVNKSASWTLDEEQTQY